MDSDLIWSSLLMSINATSGLLCHFDVFWCIEITIGILKITHGQKYKPGILHGRSHTFVAYTKQGIIDVFILFFVQIFIFPITGLW